MSTPSPAPAATPTTNKPCLFKRYVKPWLTPYYLAVAVGLGAITTVFGVLTLLLIIIVANFNILGLIE
jgi:fatty acid desaturase